MSLFKKNRISSLKSVLSIFFALLFFLTIYFFKNLYQDWRGCVVQLAEILFAGLCLSCFLPHKYYSISDKITSPIKNLLGIIATAAAVLITILFYIFLKPNYYIISLLIIAETLLPFILIFEHKKPQIRELVIISVLCAIGVAGRAAFYMLPQFKPVAAIVIISGICFGGEAGFLVGAVCAFISNFFFGQSILTPWQMLGFGLVGLIGGIVFNTGLIKKTRLSISIFGGIATLIVYGIILNTASLFLFMPNPTIEALISSYVLGFPFDLIHAASTVFFLWFAAEPMLEKLDRIRTKYGI